MTPDKEDILDAADLKWHYDEGMETTTKKAAYEAMDEYAKQEAIGFGRFVVKYTLAAVRNGEVPEHNSDLELYNLYLESKNK